MVKVKKRRGVRKISAWSRSAEFRAIGREAIIAFNRKRKFLPQCKAIAKSTGQRCGNLALPNGCCHVHGGRTPKGDQWHVLQVPAGRGKKAVRSYEQKLEKASRQERATRLRLMRATEAEREAFAKWQWTHPAGSAARRAERRLNRRIADERRFLLAENRKRPQSPEVAALEARIAELRALQAWRKLCNTGVFE